MKVLCNLMTKKIEGFSRWDDIPFEPSTHIVFDVSDVPNMEKERLNDTGDGIRPATQTELDADADAEKDEIVNFANVDPFLKAFVIAANKGTFVPGSNYTNAQMKSIIRAEM